MSILKFVAAYLMQLNAAKHMLLYKIGAEIST